MFSCQNIQKWDNIPNDVKSTVSKWRHLISLQKIVTAFLNVLTLKHDRFFRVSIRGAANIFLGTRLILYLKFKVSNQKAKFVPRKHEPTKYAKE